MAPPEFTEDDARQILDHYPHNEDDEFVSFDVKNFHDPFQGLIGEHFTLEITYKDKELAETTVQFFVKTLSSNSLMREFSKTLKVYEKEMFFYQLLSEYENYGIDISFTPQGYYFKPYIVVLEDLSKEYRCTPKRTLLDLEHTQSCLKAIAKFHAASIIYENKKEKELNEHYSLKAEYPEELKDKFSSTKPTIVQDWMMRSFEGLALLIEQLPESRVSTKKFKTKFLEIIATDFSESSVISGVLHGDLWSSNFLHKYENYQVVDTKLVDYQLLKYGPLEQDVAEFLMTNTSAENYESLVIYYYEALSETVSAADLNSEEILPSVEDFIVSCDHFKVAGCIHALLDHSYTFLPDEIYESVLQDEKSWRQFLFEKRADYILQTFNEDIDYKRMLRDDFFRLRELLFS